MKKLLISLALLASISAQASEQSERQYNAIYMAMWAETCDTLMPAKPFSHYRVKVDQHVRALVTGSGTAEKSIDTIASEIQSILANPKDRVIRDHCEHAYKLASELYDD